MKLATILDPKINFTLNERRNRLGEEAKRKIARSLPESIRYWVFIQYAVDRIRPDEVVPDVRYMDLLKRDQNGNEPVWDGSVLADMQAADFAPTAQEFTPELKIKILDRIRHALDFAKDPHDIFNEDEEPESGPTVIAATEHAVDLLLADGEVRTFPNANAMLHWVDARFLIMWDTDQNRFRQIPVVTK